jgi:hypothetical protein
MYDSTKQGKQVFRFKTKEPKTGLAIDYPTTIVTVDQLDESLIGDIYYTLLGAVPDIMELEPTNHEVTGLGVDKISTRWNKYNIFQMFEDDENFRYLKGAISYCYQQYCIQANIVIEPVMLHAWFNVMTKGDRISEHVHDYGSYSYLSGNIFAGGVDKSSYTSYFIVNQDGVLDIKNNVGDLTLFPSWLPHETGVYEGDEPRMTIGLNFIPLRFKDEYLKQRKEGKHDFLDFVVEL